MIVKTLRWKTRGFNRLVEYIGKEARPDRESFRLLHNLRPSRNLTGIVRQLGEQDSFRIPRKNGVVMYHEILSFAEGQEVPLNIVEDLTRKYLELRAPNALAYAEPHFDKGHLHVHIAISGTEFESAKTLRLDNKRFMQVRRQIEEYQREHYPELDRSLVYLNERKRNRRREDVEQRRIAELEKIQKSKTDRHLEQEQPLPDDMLEQEAEGAALEMEAEAEALRQEAALEAAHAEAEALQQQAEVEAEEQMHIEAERQAEETARIAELEAIQEEARQREQAQQLERE